jgi:hypothetical protein
MILAVGFILWRLGSYVRIPADTIITGEGGQTTELLQPETGSDSSIVVDDGNLAASRYSNPHGSGRRANLIVPFSFTATAVLYCRRRTGARIRFG